MTLTHKKFRWLCGFTYILHLLVFSKCRSEISRSVDAFVPATPKSLRHYKTATKSMVCSSPYSSSRIIWSTQSSLDRLHTDKSKGGNTYTLPHIGKRKFKKEEGRWILTIPWNIGDIKDKKHQLKQSAMAQIPSIGTTLKNRQPVIRLEITERTMER